MDYIPHIIEANYVRDYVIKVKFDDGTVKILNLESYIKRAGVFSELKDKKYFKRFFIDLNTLCWPNGADIAPERLYEIGEEISTKESLVRV